MARRIGASEEDCAAIAAEKTARFGAELMVERGLGDVFHRTLAETEHMQHRKQKGRN